MTNIVFFTCYFATIFFLVTYCKKISEILKLTDKPSKQKIHKKPTPLMGGIIVFFLLKMGVGILRILKQLKKFIINSQIIYITENLSIVILE